MVFRNNKTSTKEKNAIKKKKKNGNLLVFSHGFYFA